MRCGLYSVVSSQSHYKYTQIPSAYVSFSLKENSDHYPLIQPQKILTCAPKRWNPIFSSYVAQPDLCSRCAQGCRCLVLWESIIFMDVWAVHQWYLELRCLNGSLHRSSGCLPIHCIPMRLCISEPLGKCYSLQCVVKGCWSIRILYRNLMIKEDDFKGVLRADLMFPLYSLWY